MKIMFWQQHITNKYTCQTIKQLVAKFPYQIKFMQVLLEHALFP